MVERGGKDIQKFSYADNVTVAAVREILSSSMQSQYIPIKIFERHGIPGELYKSHIEKGKRHKEQKVYGKPLFDRISRDYGIEVPVHYAIDTIERQRLRIESHLKAQDDLLEIWRK